MGNAAPTAIRHHRRPGVRRNADTALEDPGVVEEHRLRFYSALEEMDAKGRGRNSTRITKERYDEIVLALNNFQNLPNTVKPLTLPLPPARLAPFLHGRQLGIRHVIV